MVDQQPQTAVDEATPQVSSHFPRVPKGCERAADAFFTCFYDKGKQPTGTSDAVVGNVALRECSAAVATYNKCVDAAADSAPKKLFRVPEAYRVRDE